MENALEYNFRVLPLEFDPKVDRRHQLLDHIQNEYDYVVTAVRHPVPWYRSWYTYIYREFEHPHVLTPFRRHPVTSNFTDSYRRPWHPGARLDRCFPPGATFEQFVHNATNYQAGFLTEMFRLYTGPFCEPSVNAIFRTERLHQDFVNWVYAMEGIEQLELPVQPMNRTRAEDRPTWTAAMRDLVEESEYELIERFYGDPDMEDIVSQHDTINDGGSPPRTRPPAGDTTGVGMGDVVITKVLRPTDTNSEEGE